MYKKGDQGIFGGFASESWTFKNGNESNTTDGKAFIFSLLEEVKCPVEIPQYALYNNNNNAFSFGGGSYAT